MGYCSSTSAASRPVDNVAVRLIMNFVTFTATSLPTYTNKLTHSLSVVLLLSFPVLSADFRFSRRFSFAYSESCSPHLLSYTECTRPLLIRNREVCTISQIYTCSCIYDRFPRLHPGEFWAYVQIYRVAQKSKPLSRIIIKSY